MKVRVYLSQAEAVIDTAYALCLNFCHSLGECHGLGDQYSKENMEIHEVDLNPAFSLEPRVGNLKLSLTQVNYSNSQTRERKVNAYCFKSLNFGVVFYAALL